MNQAFVSNLAGNLCPLANSEGRDFAFLAAFLILQFRQERRRIQDVISREAKAADFDDADIQ